MKKIIVFAALLCLHAPLAAAQTGGGINYHTSVIVLTEQDTADSPKTATFYFYNTFLSDPSEYHVFYIIALGTGTVNLSVGPAAVADVSYAAAGLLGIKPVFGVGLYATPIVMTARAAFFSFGAVFMASHRAEPVLGADYPVPMLMEAYFTDTAAITTTTTTAADTTTTTTAAAS